MNCGGVVAPSVIQDARMPIVCQWPARDRLKIFVVVCTELYHQLQILTCQAAKEHEMSVRPSPFAHTDQLSDA